MMLSSESVSKTAGQDRSASSTTVYVSLTSTPVSVCDIQLKKPPPATFGSVLTRRMFHATSSAVSSRPVCHCTPLRRCKRDPRVLVVDVPALDQDAFRVQLWIELDQTVPDGIDGALAVEKIAVEGRQITQVALAQDAARV